eukprot:828199-Pyramimonas_sp.AAC.1
MGGGRKEEGKEAWGRRRRTGAQGFGGDRSEQIICLYTFLRGWGPNNLQTPPGERGDTHSDCVAVDAGKNSLELAGIHEVVAN